MPDRSHQYIAPDPLLEQAHDLRCAASALTAHRGLTGLSILLKGMNAYYSGLIEGRTATPAEIEQAISGIFSTDAVVARHQRFALAHMATEQVIAQYLEQWPGQAWTDQLVCGIHEQLFVQIPKEDRALPGSKWLIPGELRSRGLAVSLDGWGKLYGEVRRGEMQLVAACASHQLLAALRPFHGGNGLVARLHTHLVMGASGLASDACSPMRGFAGSADLYRALLKGTHEHPEHDLIAWTEYVLTMCTTHANAMVRLLEPEGMKQRIAACLEFEEKVVGSGVTLSALRALHYLFVTHEEIERGAFKSLLGLSDRSASAQIGALISRGLVVTDSIRGRLRFGVPQHALRYFFPGLWPEAEGAR